MVTATLKNACRSVVRRCFPSKSGSVLFAAFLVASCQSSGVDFGLPDRQPQTLPVLPQTTSMPQKTGQAQGEVIGSGPVRVALLLPKSAPGNGAAVYAEYRNAATQAMADLGPGAIELVIKDSGGDAAKASVAAREAVSEGSAAILGPVFSPAVSGARAVSTASGVPQIAFSSDPAVAAPGAWLISVLPDEVVDQTVAQAVSMGRTSFAAILPVGAYGALVETQLRKSLAARGGTLTGIARYDYNDASVRAAVSEIAPAAQTAQAIFIPDGGATPGVIAGLLAEAQVDLAAHLLLGTGQWRSGNLAAPGLQGALFVDVDRSRFASFSQRYKARFGADPSVNAGLAYDAVLLVGGLARADPVAGLSGATLENPSGFSGSTGIFRFLADGRNERALAVYRVNSGKAELYSPAPADFRAMSGAPIR